MHIVAFIDVGNQASFKNGLKLHRSRIDGRQINVRPTVKPEELERIVELRKEKVDKVVADNTASSPKKRAGSDKEGGKGSERGEKRLKVHNTPAMLQVLGSRDKWSKSKKTRERLKLKKLEQKQKSKAEIS